MKSIIKFLPLCVVALFAVEIIAVMMPKKDGEFHVRDFGRLPALLGGRIQPLDSVARNSLLQMRSTGDLPLEIVPSWKFWHHPKKLNSTEWFLELATRPEQADTRRVFLIHFAELLGELKLQHKGIEHSSLRYYSFEELRSVVPEIGEQGKKAGEVKEEKRTTYQKQVLKLANAVMLYHRLKYTFQPDGVDNWGQVLSDFQANLGPAREAARANQAGQPYDKEALSKLLEPLQQFQAMATYGYPMVVPPEPGQSLDAWHTVGTSSLDSARESKFAPAVTSYASMASAYRLGHAEEFNRALAEYTSWLGENFPRQLRKTRAECFYNDVKAFLHAAIMYICALVLACLALVTLTMAPQLSESLRRSAFALIMLAGALHTFGLVFRMWLEGRPPVTNLYSSAIFIGWGTMLLGLALERIYRISIGNIVASFAGFMTLLIAYNLALGGDTMEMLRAVLDTNFWLSTHVVVVTLGYASTFVAGLLGILYILGGVFTPLLREKVRGRTPAAAASNLEIGKALAKAAYGIVCFATLFSFTGTVLGGIWADQSWGRFWGWDPKENGALLIVLWNAIILHARWGGIVRERGIMALVVFGNIMTSFSWFGVNMLGIGLHSYGFMDAAFKWLMFFVATQLVIIGIALLPLRLWRSFRVTEPRPSTGAGGQKAVPQGA